MVQVTGVFGFRIEFVFVKLSVGSPAGVSENVRSKTVGWKIALLPTTWAGAKGAVFWFCAPDPCPLALFTTNKTVLPPQVAGKVKLFFAPLGSADGPARFWAEERARGRGLAPQRQAAPTFD